MASRTTRTACRSTSSPRAAPTLTTTPSMGAAGCPAAAGVRGPGRGSRAARPHRPGLAPVTGWPWITIRTGPRSSGSAPCARSPVRRLAGRARQNLILALVRGWPLVRPRRPALLQRGGGVRAVGEFRPGQHVTQVGRRAGQAADPQFAEGRGQPPPGRLPVRAPRHQLAEQRVVLRGHPVAGGHAEVRRAATARTGRAARRPCRGRAGTAATDPRPPAGPRSRDRGSARRPGSGPAARPRRRRACARPGPGR